MNAGILKLVSEFAQSDAPGGNRDGVAMRSARLNCCVTYLRYPGVQKRVDIFWSQYFGFKMHQQVVVFRFKTCPSRRQFITCGRAFFWSDGIRACSGIPQSAVGGKFCFIRRWIFSP